MKIPDCRSERRARGTTGDRCPSFRFGTLWALLGFGLIPVAASAGGMGSVAVVAKTNTSITVDWTDPDGSEYRKCGNADYKFEIRWGKFFSGGISTTTLCCPTTKPYAIPLTLEPSTEYRITVFVKAEKKNVFGNWRNCEFRKIGSVTQVTDASSSASDNVAVSGSDLSSIEVTVTVANPGQFEFIRVGYKKTNSIWDLHNTLKGSSRPEEQWEESDSRRGWIDITPAHSPTIVEFGALASCRAYKLVAYGFPAGVEIGTRLGEAVGSTGAACRTFDMSSLLAANHRAVFEDYAVRVASFHAERCTSIFGHIAAGYPQILEDFSVPSDGDTLETGYDTLDYLIDLQPSVYGSWQNEPELRAAGLDLPNFLLAHYPSLFAALMEETYEGTSGASDDQIAEAPAPLLKQNVPNPFNPTTRIAFTLEERSPVLLEIFDVAGRPVRTLLRDREFPSGLHDVTWDGRDERGATVPSGLYLYRLRTGDRSEVRKMVVQK